MPWCMCRGQRMTWGCWFFLSTLQVPRDQSQIIRLGRKGHPTALSVRILIGISSLCFESVCFSTSLPQSAPLIEVGMNQLPAGPSAFSLEPPQSLIHLALAVLVSKHVSDHFPYFKGASLFLSKYLMTVSAQVPDSSEQVSILKSVFTPPTTMPSITALAANSWGNPEWG